MQNLNHYCKLSSLAATLPLLLSDCFAQFSAYISTLSKVEDMVSLAGSARVQEGVGPLTCKFVGSGASWCMAGPSAATSQQNKIVLLCLDGCGDAVRGVEPSDVDIHISVLSVDRGVGIPAVGRVIDVQAVAGGIEFLYEVPPCAPGSSVMMEACVGTVPLPPLRVHVSCS